jgi:O-antigen/teichoic acid export membrane protein
MGFKAVFYKNLAKYSSYQLLITAISFASSIITARLLTPGEYGTIALITVFTGFIAYFKDAGISFLIIRENYSNKEISHIHFFSIGLGIILFLIMLLLAYPIALFYDNTALMYPAIGISFFLIIDSFTVVPSAVLSKQLDFDSIGKSNLYALLTSIIVTIVLALLNFSYWSLIIGQLSASLVNYLILSSKVSVTLILLSYKRIIIVFRNIQGMLYQIAGSRFLSYWTGNTDNMLIGKFYGVVDIGIYNRAYQLLSMQSNIIIGSFGTVLIPSLKMLEHETMKLRKEYTDSLNLISLAGFPLMCCLLFFSKEMVNLLWGSQWGSVAEITPYFGIMAITYMLHSTFASMYILTRKEKLLMPSGLAGTIMTVIIFFIGIQYSLETFVFLFAAGYLLTVLPVQLYVATFRAGIFTSDNLVSFWLPKILISVVLVFAVYYGYTMIKIFFTLFYFIHLLIMLRQHFSSGLYKLKIFMLSKPEQTNGGLLLK